MKSTVGREGGRDGGGELREVTVCNSCREEWIGNHVVIRKVIVKKHSEPSCDVENINVWWNHSAQWEFLAISRETVTKQNMLS